MVSSRTLRAILVYTGIALLVLLACYYGSRPRGIHLTSADLLVQDTLGYPPPSRTQDWRALPGQWQQVPLPHAPRPRMVPGSGDAGLLPTQTSWYHFTLGPEQAAPAGAYIYVPRWKTDGELAIYIDGRLFYQTHANLQWNGSNRPLWIPLEEAAESTPPKDILIRIRHVRGIGGALSTLWIGDYRQLGAAYYMRAFFQAELPYISSALFLATGVFAFLIWLRSRRETLYLLYAVMTVATFLRVMHAYMGADRLPVSDAWFGWITVNSVGWTVLITHLFLTALHHHHVRVLTWIIALMCVGFGAITLPLFEGTTDATIISPLMYITMVAVGSVTFALHILWSRRAGTLEGAGLAICGLLSFILGARDMLLQNNIINIESLFVSFYAQISLIIVFCQIMLSRYLKAMKAVGEANVVLVRSLAEREAELTASHQKLREVERREVLFQERQRLMQDMHDGLGSSLVSTLRMVEHGHIDEADIAQLLKGCIDDLKLTIDSMEPVETDLLLLLGTLRFRLQPRLESTGIRLRWDVRDVPPLGWLDQRHSLHILRILQEAFTNVIKHAGASEIIVTTGVRDGCVCVGVADNGQGFDVAATGAGRGLGNQARRAEVIGGRVELLSGPQGTRFALLLPVEGAALQQSAAD
ncbi:ATP-binding protein [Sphingomonas sp. NIBR02145]|uniref:sensor histidine kinase n=1 Tax=Sphingomonas sp. NIBR02145 TaxID=3014784 RepID=UPI0022B5C75D|nr:ATP-binding protein [Sphingomonas sp. NIBR02145]WHU02913.1 hypothetical protein O3305_22495 [Sphingomonas sp. NIBR02145]